MRNKLGKYDEQKIQQKKLDEANEAELGGSIPVGSRCEVSTVGAPTRRAEVKYVGPVNFKSGVWVGVQYDEPMGKNDGSVNGKKYFDCKPKYGGFVRPSNITIGDFPELGLEELDEI
jgi:tubulin-folding cofactor B